MRLIFVFAILILAGCGSSGRNEDGVLRLSWQTGMYRLERGTYTEVIIRPTQIDLIRKNGEGIDRLWNDSSLQSAERRKYITQARQRSKQGGNEVKLTYEKAGSGT